MNPITLLAQHPFCQGLSQEQLEALAEYAAVRDFAPGDYLLRQHQRADYFLLITKGHVLIKVFVPQRGVVPVETLGAGDVLGWSWSIPPYLWHFDAYAVEPTRVVALDAAALLQQMEQDNTLGYAVLKRLIPVIARRVESARFQMLDVYGEPTQGAQ